MNRKIAGLLAGLGALLATAAPASAMMLDEFDKLAPDQMGKIVEDAVRRVHTHVFARRPDPAKAACIRKLFVPTPRDRVPRGIDLLLDDLEDVPDEERPEVDVESVVLDLINRECPSTPPPQQG